MASKRINPRVEALIGRWREIQSRQGQVDWLVARFTADVQAVFMEADAFSTFWWDVLGVRAGATIGKYARMADVVRVVPDEAVWRAAGWPAVAKVAQITNAKQRAEACKRLVAEAATAKVGQKRAEKVLADVAPEVFVPPPSVPTTKKDRQQDRMAAAKRLGSPENVARNAALVATKAAESAVKAERRRADLLAGAFKRLIGGGYGFLADLLTPEERKAAGLTTKGKAKAS